jgi:TonB-linked SusC/RagA family outer membrane protein
MKKIIDLLGDRGFPRLKKLFRTMKLTLLLILISAGFVFAGKTYSQTQMLNLKMGKTTVKEALLKIEDQSEFYFMFSSKIIDINREVVVNVENRRIDQVLTALFEGTDVGYTIKDRIIVLTTPEVLSETGLSVFQQNTISGVVTDKTGAPLPGVTVVIKGTTTGTITGADGRYSVSGIPPAATLVFSFVGMRTQEVVVGSQTVINVSLQDETIGIEEVIAIGYGTQKKSDITGSVASLNAEVIELVPVTNIAQVLQGRLAGVSISQNGGDAEGSSSILIRGANSLTASNNPLIILDGIPFSGQLSFINPSDISSTEVLKDASSTAIYGARAANGVILITTKKGKSGKPTITYTGNMSISEVINLPNLMDGQTFYNRKLEFFQNSNSSLTPQDIFTPTELEVYQSGEFANWAELGTQTGNRQEHNISISGGAENSNYFVSFGVNQTEGVAVNDKFDRYTLRINYDTQISDWLTIGTNTLLGYVDRSGRNIDFNFDPGSDHSLRTNPLTRVRNSDGSLTLFPWPENVYFANPLDRLNEGQESVIKSVNTNNYLEIQFPIDGLNYRLNTGYSSRTSSFESYSGLDTKAGFQVGGSATVDNSNSDEWVLENILNYKKEFGKHNIFLTALYSAQKSTNKQHQVRGQGFPNDIRTTYQFGAANLVSFTDNFSETSLLSQMFRANYGFDSRYLFTFTVRRDGFSGFGANTKFGTFPSAALAWNIGNESFMESVDFINILKLRASYGENGNQAIGAYSTLAGLSEAYYLDGGRNTAVGFFPRSLGDPGLSWETSKSTNFGLDFGFLKNRIQGSVDYFSTNTTDLLLNRRISPINGATSIRQNIGETATKGFEFQMSSTNISKRDFSWSTDFNLSLYRTKIVNVGLLDEFGKPVDDVGNRWFIGEPNNVFYGYIFDGIWQLGDDIANSAQPNAKPGDVRYADISGPDGIPDGVITDKDRGLQGNRQPDFIAGMNNTIRYKDLTLNFFIHTVQGVSGSSPLWSSFYNNYITNVYDYNFWSESNPINNFPANRDGTDPLGARPRGDASYIRLKDVTLSYNFNPNFLSKLKLKDFEVFLNAKNVFTITNYEFGWDPEISSDIAIPLSRTYLVGLRLSL